MRIGIGQVWQETNTFNPLPTTRADFEEFGIWRGEELLERMADTNEIGGMLQTLARWPDPPTPVGLIRLPAWPSGTMTAETFDWLRTQFLEALENAGQLDALLLALHGAMAAQEHPDAEGELLALARQHVGDEVPIVATLDLHAQVTPQLSAAADALIIYHTAPHVDVFETGERAAEVLRRIVREDAHPVTAFCRVPVVLPAERANTEEPGSMAADRKALLQKLEATPGVLTAGLATVQPWLDVPELGSVAVVVTDGNADLARSSCAELARDLWQRRKEYLPELTEIAEAVRLAHETPGLVVLSDSADATTSGAPGDSTHLLAELLKHDWPNGALVTVVAPEIVARAEALSPGTEFAGPLGGVRDNRFSRPLNVQATIEKAFDARFTVSGHLGRNLAIDMGRAIVLRQGDVRVVVTARSGPHFAPELFQAAGLDPFTVDVLVAKSPCGFRAVYADRACKIINVRAPGCAPADFWRYEYRHLSRPLFPWDDWENWQPEPVVSR